MFLGQFLAYSECPINTIIISSIDDGDDDHYYSPLQIYELYNKDEV